MIENNESGFVETTNVPEGAPSEAQGSVTAPELDVERIDNVGQLREHVKGLKSDLETYKSTHNFVAESFGDLENAKLAQQLYSGIVSDEFDPGYFVNTISELSPTRANMLAEALAEEYAPKYAEQKISEYFGGEVTPEEVELFRQWKSSGYMITQEDDIPDAFKYDAYGNPLSEEQITAFKEQFQLLNNLRSQVESQVTESQKRQQEEYHRQLEEQMESMVSDFEQSNLKVLDSDFDKFGLSIKDSDPVEVKEQKSMLKDFLVGGLGRLFLANESLARDYNTALQHLQNGEARLARRYEPRIQKGLLDIMRSEPIYKLLSSLVPEAPKQARPEISNYGVSAPTGKPADSREERIRNLVSSGALKL